VTSLVTGAGGFVGQWLIRALLERGEDVTGYTFGPPSKIGVLTPREENSVRWVEGDIRDSSAVDAVVAQRPFDAIYHLAGVTFVPAAGKDPATTFEINTLGAARLLSAVARARSSSARPPRVLVVGSAEQYGAHDRRECPLPESAAQRPLTVYAASKAAQETIALQAFAGSGLDVMVTRSFNHSGPGQNPQFLLPGIVGRIKALAKSDSRRLSIGNTEVTRDFLHVRDVTQAYMALIERGKSGEAYNVSSGKGSTVRELTQLALKIAGVDAELAPDPSLTRPVDVEWLVGDNAKLRETTGWEPERGVSDVIHDLLEPRP
jgi:GDP-4-dehydro-6-deoxy-D-mannose reductase